MTRRAIAPGRSCLECRRRKIKCDRGSPCAYCVRLKVPCQYPSSRKQYGSTKTISNKVAVDIQQNAISHQSDTASEPTTTPSTSIPDTPSSAHPFPFSSFPFTSSHLPSLEHYQPNSASKLFLWQTYIDVVDPTLKLFHVPTVQREFIAAIQDSSETCTATECLMFAVYYAVVATMPATECERALHQSKTDLLRRYRLGIEYALLKAGFMHSSNLRVLQALVIYLTFVRKSDDAPDIQSLTSLAVGNTMRIGLNYEEAGSQYSPFEVEMRRRLWWQVYVLDARNAMESGVEPTILEQTFNTKKPRNINDVALHPHIDATPADDDKKTEMTIILLRILGTDLTRRTIFSESFNKTNGYPCLSVEEQCQKLDELCDCAEMKILTRHPSQIPLDFIASATARLIHAKLKVMVCKPQPSQGRGNPFRENYLVLCLDVLRESHTVRCYKPGRPWSWLFETCVEWDALAYVLLDLCVTPSSDSSQTPWTLVSDIFEEWKGDPNLVGDRRWQHIEALWLEAVSARRATGAQMVLDDSETSTSCRTHSDICPEEGLNLTSQVEFRANCLKPQAISNMEPAIFDNHYVGDVSPSDVGGLGTSCEWGASLFEQYWEITGSG
ncbi:fungal-specific transcription factor [Fusarium avenaceum]|nr:fungal-specific transcription factor [Fusarium avenaceum]